jgi:type I restriction enzyme R subunit
LDEDEKPKIDAEIAELTEDEAESEQERLKRRWASVEALVGIQRQSGCDERDNQDEIARLDFGMIVAIFGFCNA